MSATKSQDLVAWLIKRRGTMTFEDFAALTGISKSTLQRYESGQTAISAGSRLMLARALDDFPQWAIPRDRAGNSVASHYATPPSTNYRVEELRPTYGAQPEMSEFERRLKAMTDAQTVVTDGLARYDLKAEQHVTFHQMLTMLIVRNDITPTGLAEVLQWYAFDVRARAKDEAMPQQALGRDTKHSDQTFHFMGTVG